jgi:SAM-dependent methyltransferase
MPDQPARGPSRLFREAHAYGDIRDLLAAHEKKGLCLDLPAGKGVNVEGIHAAGFRPIEADLFPSRETARGFPCLKVDFNSPLPFADGCFAAIVCSEGIEHHAAQTWFLGECARVLAPGGALVITTPNILSLRARLSYLCNGNYSFRRTPISEVTQVWGKGYLGHVHLVSYLVLRFMLKQHGLDLKKVTTAKYSLSSFLLAPFLWVPIWLSTQRLFRRTLRGHAAPLKEILGHLLSADLLFGKKLIVMARKPSS